MPMKGMRRNDDAMEGRCPYPKTPNFLETKKTGVDKIAGNKGDSPEGK